MLKVLKLVNGTEVMGKVVGETPTAILLDDPVQINYKDVGQRMPHVSVTRYHQFSSRRKKFPFRRKDVAQCTGLMKGMEAFYKKAVKDFYSDVDKQVDRELQQASVVITPEEAALEHKAELAMRERDQSGATSH